MTPGTVGPNHFVANVDDFDTGRPVRAGSVTLNFTLPGHPESGEEAFLVVRVGDGCEFRITAFSRPATLLARASGPLGRAVQRLVTDRYLAAADG